MLHAISKEESWRCSICNEYKETGDIDPVTGLDTCSDCLPWCFESTRHELEERIA